MTDSLIYVLDGQNYVPQSPASSCMQILYCVRNEEAIKVALQLL